MNSYLATYTDVHGDEPTKIINDGKTLRMVVRGVEFSGSDFDSLGPPEIIASEQLQAFPIHNDALCSCRIECQMPIAIDDNGLQANGELFVQLSLGDPAPNGALDSEKLSIVLDFDGRTYVGPGTSGWFEDELLGIQAGLPHGVFMKCCINCLYSDYSPYGHGLFGCMMCFRNIKAEYVKVKTKADFWSVHDRYDRWVQETYLCPEFTRRARGTGYRG